MKLKGKHGYYLIDNYPIGGCFRKAPDEGIELKNVMLMLKSIHGCNAYGYTLDNHKVAFSTQCTEDGICF